MYLCMEFLLAWGVGAPFLPFLPSFLSFPSFTSFLPSFSPSIHLVMDERSQAGSGHGEHSVGWCCTRELSERENLPTWLLMLDLLSLRWGVLRCCFPSVMLKQKFYLWAILFGTGLFQLEEMPAGCNFLSFFILQLFSWQHHLSSQ